MPDVASETLPFMPEHFLRANAAVGQLRKPEDVAGVRASFAEIMSMPYVAGSNENGVAQDMEWIP